MAAETNYQSLRLYEPVHKLRQGSLPKLVEANSQRTITYREAPFPQFLVMPEGVEIPIHNVASAIPVGAGLADKMARTVGAMRDRRELRLAKAKAAAE
jgi:hypothetical protein